ncbi:MAG: PKD domain-containing protein [Bacteroidota bacterium]
MTTKPPINGYQIFWDFGDGSTDNSTVSPIHTYTNRGSYTVELTVISPNGCVANAVFPDDIRVDSIPTADFDWNFENCSQGLTNFENQSSPNDGEIAEWAWNFDNGQTSDLTDPTINLGDAGIYDVFLQVTDSNQCTDTIRQAVEWFPPATIDIQLDDDLGCYPHTVQFEQFSDSIPGYEPFWEFGDGASSTRWAPNHVYADSGLYTVRLSVTNPIECPVSEVFEELILVIDPPFADFSYSPERPNNFEPEVEFENLSQNAQSWFWDFGNGDDSNQESPTYSYPDTGLYLVTLFADQYTGCRDSLSQLVDVEPQFTYFLPNAFSPNFDGLNDEFRGTGLTETIRSFEMNIFNRWGELVFQTNNPNDSWNGKKNNTGVPSPQGVYVYSVRIISGRGEVFTYEGFVTLIR